MSYVAFELATWRRLKSRQGAESFTTEKGAKRVLSTHLKKTYGDNAESFREAFAVTTYDEWRNTEPEVDTYNLMDPEKKPIKIRLSEKGGCCDPATKRYHSM